MEDIVMEIIRLQVFFGITGVDFSKRKNRKENELPRIEPGRKINQYLGSIRVPEECKEKKKHNSQHDMEN